VARGAHGLLEDASAGVRAVDDCENLDAFGITTSSRTNLDSFAVGFVSQVANDSWPVSGGSTAPVAGISRSSSRSRSSFALCGA
jgi:hypothetical protein